jgi:hypothetical protein
MGHPTKGTPSQKTNFASNLFYPLVCLCSPLLDDLPKPREGGREEPKREERKKDTFFWVVLSIGHPHQGKQAIPKSLNPPKNGSINTFSPTPTTSTPLTQFDKKAKIGYLFDAVFRLFLVSKMRLKRK